MAYWFFTEGDGRSAFEALVGADTPNSYHQQSLSWLKAYENFVLARTQDPTGYPWPSDWPDAANRSAWYHLPSIHVGPEHVPDGPLQESVWPSYSQELRSLAAIEREADRVSAVFEKWLSSEKVLDRGERAHRLLAAFLALSIASSEATRENTFSTNHADPAVRSMLVSLAQVHHPSPAAIRYLRAATHDTDDSVFVRAFHVIGQLRIEEALLDLLHIVSPASLLKKNKLENRDALVVGLAAANAHAACCAVLGSEDPELLEQREKSYRARHISPLFARHSELKAKFSSEMSNAETTDSPRCNYDLSDTGGMVFVPSGPFLSGADRKDVPFRRFDDSTYTPLSLAFTNAYYIDRYAVTNAEYDEFVAAMEGDPASASRYEHPDQRPGKPHRRNTWDDPRFGSDHPVVGIDWYDAYAFAHWRGKSLPTEQEWEKATRGVDGRLFPWGNEWDNTRVHGAEAVFGGPIQTIIDWRTQLVRYSRRFPEKTTTSIFAHGDLGTSPFGVMGMLGNAWEYTCTEFSSGRQLTPQFRNLHPSEFMHAKEAQVVIKGGAWSSIPELTSAPYRGQDLLTDRHCEIGFRCVRRLRSQSITS